MTGQKRKLVALDPTAKSAVAEQFDAGLRARVIGQDRAVRAITSLYQVFQAGMTCPTRPLGSMLFLGPTGSGKTHGVEAAAEILFGDRNAVIKIDCGEFQHSHEIAKLIGSPPGYLGHRETHPLLSQEVLNQFHTETTKISFILFDEIEKASDSLWNLLLGILDKGILTLGDNRKVNFSRAMIFMTSNLGANEMSKIISPGIGFGAGITNKQKADIIDDKLSLKLNRSGMQAARRKFTPEFMNRLDKIVTFQPLGVEQLQKILEIELNMVQQRIFNSSVELAFVFTLSDKVKDFLIKEGTDIKYGARHMKRAIERLLVQPMSNLIASGQVRGGDWIRVDFDEENKTLTFTREAEGLPVQDMAKLVDTSVLLPVLGLSKAPIEPARTQTARSSKRS